MPTTYKPVVSKKEVEKIIYNQAHDPFEILGPHKIDDNKWAIRAWLPDVTKAILLVGRQKIQMHWVYNPAFYEVTVDWDELKSYKFELTNTQDETYQLDDPYRFLPQISSDDQFLFGKGDHHRMYEKFGAHLTTIDGVKGVLFAVWAPNARNVSIVGNFNGWHGGKHQMRVLGSSGIWELFIPGMCEGDVYKYEIKDQHGTMLLKTDPYGFASEQRPSTASIVWDVNKYDWNDNEWMDQRQNTDPLDKPISVYEVHLGSWKRVPEDNGFLNYRDLAHEIVDYAVEMNYTHIECLPVAEHPLDASWGYQVTGYFAPTSRFGSPDDFKYFVDYAHQKGLGIIVDWVPAHFPKDAHGLAYFDGSYLYEHSDPRQGEHQDWGTLIFNFGRNEVKNFLISNALFWFDKYHIDGIRVDAVASMLYLDYSREDGEWVPNKWGGRENLEAIEFIKHLNELIFKYYPNVLSIAEESTSWAGVSKPTYLGGLGFNIKWNMGWMHDFLTYFGKDPVHRRYHHNMITFALLYAFHENFMLVLSHDEVVHGKRALLDKMPGDYWQKFANLRTLYGFMYGHPGKKLLFMGSEFGQWQEWKESQSLDWHLTQFEPHQKIQLLVKDLNHLLKTEPALHQKDFDEHGFEWIDFMDSDNSVISFLRKTDDPKDTLVFVCNFTPVYRDAYRVGVPFHCYYTEIMNTDAEIYWGSNKGNMGGVHADQEGWHGKQHSINIQLPPLATVVFKPQF